MNNNLLSQPWVPVALGGGVLILIHLVWPWLRSFFLPKQR